MLAGISAALFAGNFTAPAEGPVAFRRDQIPLDEEAMAGLSKQLESLARGMNPATAQDRRGVAQMLALALALDPANAKGRELLVEYQEARHKPATDSGQFEKQRPRILPLIAWLETPQAGSQGQALAACLKDVLVIADPQHPAADESGAWAGWIPDITAYQATTAAKNAESTPRAPAGDPHTKNEIPLGAAEVHTLLWQKVAIDDSTRWILAVAPLQMSATRMPDDSTVQARPFTIVIGAARDGGLFAQTNGLLLKVLQTYHKTLPPGYRVSITSAELEQSSRSRKLQTLSAAAAVLASSAVTGREPEAIILGQIDESGAYKLPTGFWDQLQALGKGSGQRLVLPAAAAAYLPAMLALENPGFFLEYEVLIAADFKQLLDLTSKQPAAAMATTTAKFREVRERSDAQDVRQYISNRFVRQHLAEILQEAPFHESAKMLLIQAAGKRPVLVPRSVLAAELRRAIKPMDWIVAHSSVDSPPDAERPPRLTIDYEFTPAEIAKFAHVIDRCHSRVEELDRHADKNDRELIELTRKVISALRSLDRATRLRGEYFAIHKSIRSAYGELTILHKELSDKLASEAGE